MRSRSLSKLFMDMETGLRGYLLTGEDHFLEPYRNSAEAVEPAIEDLTGLTREDPQQQRLMKELKDYFKTWRAYSLQVINMRRNSGRPLSDRDTNMQGKQIMEACRRAPDEVLRLEELRLQSRIARLKQIVTGLFVTAVLLSMMMGLLISTFSRRQLAKVARSFNRALLTAEARTEELNQSQRWLGTVLGSIGDGVLATDKRGHIMFSNSVAQEILGLSMGDINDRPTNEMIRVVDEYTRKPVPDAFQKVMEEHKPFEPSDHKLLLRHDGKEVPVTLVAFPMRHNGVHPNGVVIVLRDMTAQRQSERTLQSAEKMASMGRIAATVAHEIHNPLDALGNLLYLLEHSSSLDNNSKTYVRLAQEELERVTNISAQMLTFSREARQPVEVNLTEVLDNVLTLFEGRIRRMGVTVVKDYQSELPVFALPGEMRQVFSNLVGNALDAMNGPGRLTVKTETSHAWRGFREPGVRVIVCDTGSGIPAEVRPLLMNPFVTSKGEKGTGLGLWVSRGIVAKYHGSLRYRTSTTPGHSGTCFSVFFPTWGKERESATTGRSEERRAS
jgi:PAS domain S-box-containing protein